MYSYQCGNCSHTFTHKEAKCDDWSNPAKSFICPSCETPLAKMTVSDAMKIQFQPRNMAIMSLPIFGMSIGGALGKILPQDQFIMVFGAIFVVVFGLAIYFRKPPEPILVQPFKEKVQQVKAATPLRGWTRLRR